MVGCHDAADFAPYFGAIFTRRHTCNVDARTAVALDDVVHGHGTRLAFMK